MIGAGAGATRLRHPINPTTASVSIPPTTGPTLIFGVKFILASHLRIGKQKANSANRRPNSAEVQELAEHRLGLGSRGYVRWSCSEASSISADLIWSQNFFHSFAHLTLNVYCSLSAMEGVVKIANANSRANHKLTHA